MLPNAGISVDKITQQLEDEGVEGFNQPFDKLMKTLAQIDAVQGTAAHEYIVDVRKLEDMVSDPGYIGSFIEPAYGYLSIFTDGSSLKTEITSEEERKPISMKHGAQ